MSILGGERSLVVITSAGGVLGELTLPFATEPVHWCLLYHPAPPYADWAPSRMYHNVRPRAVVRQATYAEEARAWQRQRQALLRRSELWQPEYGGGMQEQEHGAAVVAARGWHAKYAALEAFLSGNHGPSRTHFTSRSVRRALLMPQDHSRLVYRCGRST